MKIKFFLLSFSATLLLGVYGWRCTSAKKIHNKKPQREASQSAVMAPDNPGVVNPTISSSPSSPTKSFTAGISISTAHAVPLYKDIHSACTVDIFYSKKNQTRD